MLLFSEIIDWKKWGYLNAQKAAYQNTYEQSKCPKHCINLHGSVFVIFFGHSERKSDQTVLFK